MKRKTINSLAIIFFIMFSMLLVGGSATAFPGLQEKSRIICVEEKLEQARVRNQELVELIGEFEAQLGKFEAEIEELEAKLENWQEKYASLEMQKSALEEKIKEMSAPEAVIPRQEETIPDHNQAGGRQVVDDAVDDNIQGGSRPVAYLTFDDGPSKNTLQILDILKEQCIKATFFVNGNNLSGEPGIYKRIADEGHTLGNHTFTHDFATIYQSVDNFMQDFLQLEDFLRHEAGMTTGLMRFPGGSSALTARKVAGYNIMEELIPVIRERGYDYFDWNIDSGDGTAKLTATEILENIKAGSERVTGDLVILFHDSYTKKTTVEALPQVITELKQKGYEFASLSPGVTDAKHR